MNRKIIATVMGVMVLLLGCSFVQQSKTMASDPVTPSETLTPTPPTVRETANPQLQEANVKFGFNLWRQLQQQEGVENTFISPTSVTVALSLLLQGADGTTQQEMLEVLELQGMSLEDINSANQALYRSLGEAGEGVELAIANSLWTHEGISFKPEFLQANRQYYDAEVESLDFASPETLGRINTWVSENTEGKITEIIDRISPDDVLYLINAIYFKGNWTRQFDPEETQSKPFFIDDSADSVEQNSSTETTVSVEMMSQSGEYRYAENEEFQAVSLPYGEEQHLSMYIFLPRPDSNLQEFSQQLTAENWQLWMQRFGRRDGKIELPRFKMEYEMRLNEALQALGMETIFSPQAATFSKMTDEPVVVNEVKHKTFVEVNEEGTEAAAVTSIGVRTTSMPPPPFEMVVNRPFFFAIRDDRTGMVLFMGSMVEP
ncbi:MAG: serpin family protein [Cyanobacteriota bacterium]|nr:serpin family protein [Cyanobacteriota bacterium]